MTFNEANDILNTYISDYSDRDYDGIIVKKLSSSNTLDDGRSTNQTHIAITGEQMNMFPYLLADGYSDTSYSERDDSLKKYFMLQVPVNLNKYNISDLGGDLSNFVSLPNGDIKTNTTIIRSRRENQTDQIQLSFLNYDDKQFVEFRKLLHTDDYLIFAKIKNTFEYDCFGVNNLKVFLNDNDLEQLNNHFYNNSTQTVVSVKTFSKINNHKKINGGINKIYYGAPGCGKSNILRRNLDDLGVVEDNRIRCTFHPDYTNTDFVGQIIPTIEEKIDEITGIKTEVVEYKFSAGPFALALLQAYRTNEAVYLIIEELNRGHAEAIFGDIFQLLDREDDLTLDNYGSSRYPIVNPVLGKYLHDELAKDGIEFDGRIVIPGNLYILATMNTSDQNVVTLDTAFKRRWLLESISNDIINDSSHPYKNYYIPGTDVTWATFLTKVNDKILDNKIYNQTNEDKRMGKYFISKNCLCEEKNSNDINASQLFGYKVLEYIWNDVCKIGREDWFDVQKYRTLEDLIDGFMHPAANTSPLAIFQNIDFGDN